MSGFDETPPPSWQEIAEGLAGQVARVKAIHARNTRFPHYCVNCRGPWPCKTIRALGPLT